MRSRESAADGSPTLAHIVPTNVKLRIATTKPKMQGLLSINSLCNYICCIAFYDVVNADGDSYELAG